MANQRDFLSHQGLGYYDEDEQSRRSNLLQRADQLQDMFGKRPMNFKEFTEKSGGSGFWQYKALNIVSGIALAVGVFNPLILIAAVPLSLYASYNAFQRNRDNMDKYGEYLNNFANEARKEFIQQIKAPTPSQQQEMSADMRKSFVEEEQRRRAARGQENGQVLQ